MNIIKAIVIAVCIAVAVTLGCILLGGILATINVAIAITVGGFIKSYATAIGILSGIYYYATH